MKEDIERRRMEAAERMKSLSTSSVDGDEMFSPFSPKTPTHKVNITCCLLLGYDMQTQILLLTSCSGKIKIFPVIF